MKMKTYGICSRDIAKKEAKKYAKATVKLIEKYGMTFSIIGDGPNWRLSAIALLKRIEKKKINCRIIKLSKPCEEINDLPTHGRYIIIKE